MKHKNTKTALVPIEGKARQMVKGINMVKRAGNLWNDVISMENLRRAYLNARKGKTYRSEVQKVDSNPE